MNCELKNFRARKYINQHEISCHHKITSPYIFNFYTCRLYYPTHMIIVLPCSISMKLTLQAQLDLNFSYLLYNTKQNLSWLYMGINMTSSVEHFLVPFVQFPILFKRNNIYVLNRIRWYKDNHMNVASKTARNFSTCLFFI